MSGQKIKSPVTKGVAKVPVIMQMEALECGAASLSMIFAYFGNYVPLEKMRVETDYTGLGKIQYILGQKGIRILNSEYTDRVALEVLLPDNELKSVMSEITEGTNGQAKMELLEECYFADVEGEMMIFED